MRSASTFDRMTFTQECKFGMHLLCTLIAFGRRGFARLEDHCVQFEQSSVRAIIFVCRQTWKVQPVFAGNHLVEDLAKAVEVCLGGARTFGRDVSVGADERFSFGNFDDQTYVGELWDAVYKDNVRRFDVTVNEVVRVKVFESGRESQRNGNAFVDWQCAAGVEVVAESARKV